MAMSFMAIGWLGKTLGDVDDNNWANAQVLLYLGSLRIEEAHYRRRGHNVPRICHRTSTMGMLLADGRTAHCSFYASIGASRCRALLRTRIV